MAYTTIDSKLLSRMFIAGAKNLEAKKEWINELNVFPVPDGDTGTNMTMTIMSAARELTQVDDSDMKAVCKAMSSGSLRGARGNSGVILSQLIRGFTKIVKTKDALTVEDLNEAFEHSERCLIDAYSRMDMKNQAWAGHADNEVSFIESFVSDKENLIVDFGCGNGRHLAELINRGFTNSSGFDFSPTRIDSATASFPQLKGNVSVADCREIKLDEKADLILCLYDVIGSFADEKQNQKIVKQIYKLELDKNL